MSTSPKTGPASQPSPLSPKQSAALEAARHVGPMTEDTKKAIAEHRERYLKAREARQAQQQEEPIIRPVRDPRFAEDFAASGMLPLDGGKS